MMLGQAEQTEKISWSVQAGRCSIQMLEFAYFARPWHETLGMISNGYMCLSCTQDFALPCLGHAALQGEGKFADPWQLPSPFSWMAGWKWLVMACAIVL